MYRGRALCDGDSSLRSWGLTDQNYMAAALSENFKADFAERFNTLRARYNRPFAHAATAQATQR